MIDRDNWNWTHACWNSNILQSGGYRSDANSDIGAWVHHPPINKISMIGAIDSGDSYACHVDLGQFDHDIEDIYGTTPWHRGAYAMESGSVTRYGGRK